MRYRARIINPNDTPEEQRRGNQTFANSQAEIDAWIKASFDRLTNKDRVSADVFEIKEVYLYSVLAQGEEK